MAIETYNGPNGSSTDRIELVLGGEQVLLAETYQVKCGILTQPAGFSIRMGWGDEVVGLITKYPPRSKFQILINGRIYQTGYTDGYETSGVPAQLTIKGRDALAQFHDAFVEQEFSVKDATYAGLIRKCLDDVGLKDSPLAYSNKANRKAIIGGQATEKSPPRNVEQEKIETEAGGVVKRTVQAELGERFYEFAKRHLDHAGLFLWAAADGSFVLSEPNAKQDYVAYLTRRWTDANHVDPQHSNILDDSHANDTVGRYAKANVYLRGGGKRHGRTKAIGSFVDDEMTGWGFTKTLTIHDPNADTPAKAEFMARRKIAETRRAGWRLSYKVQGHTTIPKSGGPPITWAPDTLVRVEDDKLGIHGEYYVESVQFDSSPQTTTTLNLMRTTDLLFAAKEHA